MSQAHVEVVSNSPVAAPPSGELRRQLATHHRRLLTYARMLVGDESTAEDLVQETLERALRASHRFRAGSNAGAWLMRILKNRFTDRYRHLGAMREVDIDRVTSALVADAATPPSYLDVVTNQDVLEALASLDERLRETFVMRYLDGLPYDQIAERCGVPMSTVGTRLMRARLRLRRIIEARIPRTSMETWS